MRALIVVFLIWASIAGAQTTEVFPGELKLTVSVENDDVVPYEQEMVLVTIHGEYRRHITLEKLEQPEMPGFNWLQLGQDHWFDTQVAGKKVKNLVRRMALYPDKAGTLEIGAFVHHLTLTDEGDDWFDHEIRSEPFTIQVQPAPKVAGWWLPVRQLRVSDDWSNAPDQLQPGEGVLRVIRLEAVGVGPDMLPPMPELHSPSAMIFAHPEKRLVDLSPEGPVSVAYWRWTIRPGNDTSAIVEPLSFDYFDTRNRVARTVTISAQRVAMDAATLPPPETSPEAGHIYRGAVLTTLVLSLGLGLAAAMLGRRFGGLDQVRRLPLFDPLRRALQAAAVARDLSGLRRAAVAMMRRDGADSNRMAVLSELDRAVFDPGAGTPDSRAFARRFLSQSRRKTDTFG